VNFVEKENFFFSSEVNIAVRSPLRSSNGPALVLIGTFNSLAMICASVSFQDPAGRKAARDPALRHGFARLRWRSGYFLYAFCPMYSSRRLGRTLT